MAKRTLITIQISPELKGLVENYVEASGESKSLLVRNALREYFAAHPGITGEVPRPLPPGIDAAVEDVLREEAAGNNHTGNNHPD